jgi:predicted AAA+ superfamily ATPase
MGGFPEVQGFKEDHWRRTLQSYQDIAVLRDVAERHAIGNLPALRFIVRRLLRSIASRTSAHALHQDLRSQGIAIAKDRVYEILGHLEDAFLVFFLPLCDASERRRQMNPRKVYAIDHGLVRACVPVATRDQGHHLENLVYLELRRRGSVLGYHLTKAGHEVDFVFEAANGERELIQVCADLAEPETRERELRALRDAVEETGIEVSTVVCLQPAASGRGDGTDTRIVQASEWLLR